jgi:TrpR-related protein YerC/YecD
MDKWKNNKTEQLFNAFLVLKTTDEVASFCRDLMTEPEINEFASRLEVAKLLNDGKTQRQVSTDSGVSIATVTRVNQWLRRGMDGYITVLERLFPQIQKHHSPH